MVNEGRRNNFKEGARKFGGAQNARTMRAAQRKVEQKSQRSRALGSHRVMNTPLINEKDGKTPYTKLPASTLKSLKSTSKKYTNKELENLSSIRYQDMLEWKKKKEEIKIREKRQRKPHFITGVVNSEPGKFLTGQDEPDFSKTPWKSTPMGSSVKKSATPFHGRRSNAVRKTLLSRTSVTPAQPNKTPALRFGDKKAFGFQPNKKSSKALQKTLKDLGLAPLAVTPATSQGSLLKPTRAITKAPAFQPPPGLKYYDLGSDDKSPVKEDDSQYSPTTRLKQLCEVLQRSPLKPADDSVQSIENEATVETGNEIVGANETTTDVQKESPLKLSLSDEEDPSNDDVKGHFEDLNVTEEFAVEDFELTKDEHLMDLENLDEKENKRLTFNAGATPAPFGKRRRTRNSSMCCDASPMTRLRPRTPCSRSTRRSQSAHCDFPAIDMFGTPKRSSAKKPKKARKSTVSFAPTEEHEEASKSPAKVQEIETPSEVQESIEIPSEVQKSIETPSEVQEPIETPSEVQESIETPSEVQEPIETPSEVQEPIETPSEVQEPIETPSEVQEPIETHSEVQEPIETHSEVQEPIETHSEVQESVKTPSGIQEFNETPFASEKSQKSEVRNETPSSIQGSTCSSPFKTPSSIQHPKRVRSRVSNLIDMSPWITKSRGSSSASGKKRRSVFTNDLETMFNDTPLGGFQDDVVASPLLKNTLKLNQKNSTPEGANSSFKENLTPRSELALLILPSSTRHDLSSQTPEVVSWSPGPDGITPEIVLPTAAEARIPFGELPTTTSVLSKGKKKSKRSSSSVSFASSVTEGDTSHTQYPVTPLKPSSRESISSFLSPLVFSNDENIPQIDSRSMSEVRNPKLSLLPGLETHPEEPSSGVNTSGDLMSFDSPVKPSKKRQSKLVMSNGTPVRRSKRLSRTLALSEIS